MRGKGLPKRGKLGRFQHLRRGGSREGALLRVCAVLQRFKHVARFTLTWSSTSLPFCDKLIYKTCFKKKKKLYSELDIKHLKKKDQYLILNTRIKDGERRGKAGRKILRNDKLLVRLSNSIPTWNKKFESLFLPDELQQRSINGTNTILVDLSSYKYFVLSSPCHALTLAIITCHWDPSTTQGLTPTTSQCSLLRREVWSCHPPTQHPSVAPQCS